MGKAAVAISILLLMTAEQGLAAEVGLHHQELPESSPILAFYDFEQPEPSGPDTFWVRQTGESEVALSSAFRFNGERALHITEVPDNRDFAEFLAYFRECREGAVFVQFYLLLTDPEQRFNFGLAGPEWFLSTERHGQALWLQTDEGFFRHRSAKGWQTLFEPRSFAWYFIDFVYHIDKGKYDLAIYEEGLEEPLVDLRKVPSMNDHDHSAVKYFSLIGDLEDAGRFDFFVDDLLIATDPEVLQKPFVAPGRRHYFVDMLRMDKGASRSRQKLDDLLWAARDWLDELSTQSDSQSLDRLEAAGDAAFEIEYFGLAEEIYRALLPYPDRRIRMLLKLADVRYLQGDVEAERELREKIYGRLEVE